MAGGGRRAAVLTISDGVFYGTRTDDSGRLLAESLIAGGFDVTIHRVVSDERSEIEPALVELAEACDLVISTGGTGLGPRDVTPEATLAVVERLAPGLAEAIRADGRTKTPMAILSRGITGVLKEALVINLPGSPKAVKEGLEVVLPLLGHAMDLISGHTQHKAGPPPAQSPQEAALSPAAKPVQTHLGHKHDHSHDEAPKSDATVPAAPATAEAVAAAPSWDFAGTLAKRMEQGEETILATAIRTEGAPPCTVGQKMILGPGGPIAGTLGCSDFDTTAANEAAQILAGGVAVLRTYKHDLGTVEVYLEPYAAKPRLVLIGATPIALWLLKWGRDLGYEPILVEDRPDWITPEHRAAASQVLSSAEGIKEGSEVDVVHTDHEAPTVPQQVAAVLGSHPRFVGILGSSRHTAGHLEQLRTIGVDDTEITRIQSPVGLNFGAKTPPEIALSILAGLMRHRTGRRGNWLDSRYEDQGEKA